MRLERGGARSWCGIANAAPVAFPWRDLQPEVDVLVVNAVEARLVGPLTSRRGRSSPRVRRGATLIQGGQRCHVPAPPVAAIDTTGAGDVLCGVLAAALDRRHAAAGGAGACRAGGGAQGNAGGHLVRAAYGGRAAGDPRLTRRRPTIREVATLAGVSIGTVSNVLTSRRGVRPETRAKIDAAIRTLGFVPDLAARSLIARRGRARPPTDPPHRG